MAIQLISACNKYWDYKYVL